MSNLINVKTSSSHHENSINGTVETFVAESVIRSSVPARSPRLHWVQEYLLSRTLLDRLLWVSEAKLPHGEPKLHHHATAVLAELPSSCSGNSATYKA